MNNERTDTWRGITKTYFIKSQGMPDFADELIYPAIQRVLENIWMGKSSPIERACHQIRREYVKSVHPYSVKIALAEFINLIVRKGFCDEEEEPEVFKKLRKMDHSIKEELYKGIIEDFPQDLEELRKRSAQLTAILSPLKSEVWDKDRQITKFRERKRQHDANFAKYQRRMNELKQAEKELQDDLTKLSGVSPVDLEKLIKAVSSIAQYKGNTDE